MLRIVLYSLLAIINIIPWIILWKFSPFNNNTDYESILVELAIIEIIFSVILIILNLLIIIFDKETFYKTKRLLLLCCNIPIILLIGYGQVSPIFDLLTYIIKNNIALFIISSTIHLLLWWLFIIVVIREKQFKEKKAEYKYSFLKHILRY